MNKLDPVNRKNNLLLAGLWFDRKCSIQIFLSAISTQLKRLESEGFTWTDKGNAIHHTRVFTLLCVADAPMRASIQQMKQYNGFYGCGYCEHPGTRFSGRTVYDYKEEVNLRSASETKWISENLPNLSVNDRKGVKGINRLATLAQIDVIRSFPPDYLHAVLLGVVRQLMTLWFASTHHRKPWYIGTSLELIDTMLVQLKPTHDIRRRPRSLKEMKYWRASEYKHFLLFWGPIVLRDVLPATFYNHFLLLSSSIYELLKDKITTSDLRTASYNLVSFSCNFEVLYGHENATYNNHLLLHIPRAVTDWGPLWAWSASPFESYNYVLKSSLHGSQSLAMQLDRIFFELGCFRNGMRVISHKLAFKHTSGTVCYGVSKKILSHLRSTIQRLVAKKYS